MEFPFGGGGGWFEHPSKSGTIVYFELPWSQEVCTNNDIMVLEMWCQLVARALLTSLKAPEVRVEFMDNQAVERAVVANKTRNKKCSSLLSHLGKHEGIVVLPFGIDSDDNEWADLLSRGGEQLFLEQVAEEGLVPLKVHAPSSMLEALEAL
jgi:hypothetical protein